MIRCTWHQQLRRTTGVPGSYLLSLMPRPFHQSHALPARLLKRYLLVFASFIVSGFIHACGSYNVTRALNLPISDGGELKYFMLQGVALMVEDFGCWLLGIDDRVAPTRMRRWLGYTVTATWYIWSRVVLRAVPMLVVHGIHDKRGPLFSAVEIVERGAVAVPGNFVTAAISHWVE
jgi:Membrane bound O-acyl transferase family